MSWLTGLAGKAEDLLNRMDQAAGQAISSKESSSSNAPNPVRTSAFTPTVSSTMKRQDSLQGSASVPSNLNQLNGGSNPYLSQMSRSTNGTVQNPQSSSPVNRSKKDKDDELFEFLNNPNAMVENGNGKKKEGAFKSLANGKHSRHSSTSSMGSHRSQGSSRTPDPNSEGGGRVTPLTVSGIFNILSFIALQPLYM